MALSPKDSYPGQIDVTDPAGYPHGKAQNETNPGDDDGTPLEEAWVSDHFGFQQALLAAAGITPSGTPDKVGASQYLDALGSIAFQSSALNFQRYVDVLYSGVTPYFDVLWEPQLREFLFLAYGDLGSGNDTFYRRMSHFLAPMPSSVSAMADGDFTRGWATSDDMIVLAQRSGSGILRGNVQSGFSPATTPPTDPVAIGRPVYAWDIGTFVVGGTSGARYYSTDDGDTWTGVTIGSTDARTGSPTTDGTRIIMPGGAGADYTYSDDGIAWTAAALPNAVVDQHFAWSMGDRIFMAGGREPATSNIHLFLSTDGGETFLLQGTHDVGGAEVYEVGFVGRLLLVALSDGRLMASDDYGVTLCEVGLSLQSGIYTTATASRTRIFSGPFAPNMFVTFASDGVGAAEFQRDVITSLRPRL